MLLESEYWRGMYWEKGEITVFRRPATRGEGGLISKANSPLLIVGQELLRGISGVYGQREGAVCRTAQIFEIGHSAQ